MAIADIDPEKIRTIVEKIAPLSRLPDTNLRLLATQVIELCNILTGDDEEIIDPKTIGGSYNHEAAVAGVMQAAKDDAKKITD